MIETVTGSFEIMHYSDKKLMTISNLAETMWLGRYPWPVEIAYDQGGEFLSQKFKNISIQEEYVI